ncbi:MAG: hypothetical protein MPJ24_10515 [Pirellulaceae bacterium]|nr:hypothetical protein [Pirellulaceae bacterium]
MRNFYLAFLSPFSALCTFLLLLVIFAGTDTLAVAQQGNARSTKSPITTGLIQPKPVYLKEPLFSIPFQLPHYAQKKPQEVQLYFARPVENWFEQKGQTHVVHHTENNAQRYLWNLYDRKGPESGAFRFQAKGEGVYLFATEILFEGEKPQVSQQRIHALKPELAVIVDTTLPELTFDFQLGVQGQVALNYFATDKHLDQHSLQISYRMNAKEQWRQFTLEQGEAEIAGIIPQQQSGQTGTQKKSLKNLDQIVTDNSLRGQFIWWPKISGKKVELQAIIADKAGNRQAVQKVIVLPKVALREDRGISPGRSDNPFRLVMEREFASQYLSKPKLESSGLSTAKVKESPERLPAQRWVARKTPKCQTSLAKDHHRELANYQRPLTNDISSHQNLDGQNNQQGNHLLDAQVGGEQELGDISFRWPEITEIAGHAQNQGTQGLNTQNWQGNWEGESTLEGQNFGQSVENAGKVEDSHRVGGQHGLIQEHFPKANEFTHFSLPTPIASREVVLEYESELPLSDLAKVGLWQTADRGVTWQLVQTDTNPTGKLIWKHASDGLYGYKIVFHTVGGYSGLSPKPGAEPDHWVLLDTQKPTGRITSVHYGKESERGTIVLSWEVVDENLEEKSVSLYVRSQHEKEWALVAQNLPATGRYAWLPPQGFASGLYFQLRGRDRAGNRLEADLTEPISLAPLRPRGFIKRIIPKGSF